MAAFMVMCRIVILGLMAYCWLWQQLVMVMRRAKHSGVTNGQEIDYDYELMIVFGRVVLWLILLAGAGAFDAIPPEYGRQAQESVTAEQAEK